MSVMSSPNPGVYNNVLRGVTAIAADDVWAVGDYNDDPAHPTRHILTMHWDGTRWNVVQNPDRAAIMTTPSMLPGRSHLPMYGRLDFTDTMNSRTCVCCVRAGGP